MALCWTFAIGTLFAQPAAESRFTLNQRDVPIAEAMDMLSRQTRVNILLSRDVTGNVSFNLYDVTVDEAIRSIASAAGYAVERVGDSYFVIGREEAKQYSQGGVTTARAFDIQYADPQEVLNLLTPYLSGYGKITALPERKMIVVEDTQPFLTRVQTILQQVDRPPNQILIEARILEVSLDDEESYGIDWQKVFPSNDGEGTLARAVSMRPGGSATRGFFLDVLNSDIRRRCRC